MRSDSGIVVSQHRKASEAGAGILRAGGNAVDAAVATAFALGAAEPWMSGLGGVGHMIVGRAGETPAVVDFGTRSPRGIDPSDYPLDSGISHDLFPWTRVIGDRNTLGPLSVCAPTMAPGMGLAWERFGTLEWRELVAPAVAIAREGLAVDWYTRLIVSSVTADLQANPAAAKMFLDEGGTPPSGSWVGDEPRNIPMDRLADTLEEVARSGPRAMLDGEVAKALVKDVRELGGALTESDLLDAQPALARAALTEWHGGSRVWTVPGLTGGTSLAAMLRRWQAGGLPAEAGPGYLAAIAEGGIATLQERLERMGHSDAEHGARQGCTTSLCVTDRDGLAAAITITLVSMFGSKVLSPSTGILLNNGISWFDPEPGKPNSLAPGQPVLTNMAPTLAEHGDGRMIAIGAAGGRQIVPAIAQVLAGVLKLGRTLEETLAMPRIDFRGDGTVNADSRLDPEAIASLARRWKVTRAEPTVFPYHFGIVSAAESRAGAQIGCPEPFCPNASASAA